MKLLASLLVLAAVSASAADLTLQVSGETAPAGGFAQFKISPAVPALVSAGGITMDFDPAVFGNVVSVAVLSAKGDQIGTANVANLHVATTFTSASASLGQLPGIPVMVVTVPVLATAKIGATSAVTITAGTWLDQLGNAYNVNVTPGTFTVGGSVSIQSVTPNSGLLAAGTILSIAGTGFDSTSTVAIDGASVASTQFVSATQLNVTLGGATEMTGKHVRIGSVDFVSALPAQGGAAGGSGYGLILPILPAPRSTPVGWDYPISTGFVQYYSVLQNPSAAPVRATYYFENSSSKVTAYPIVIPPYGTYVANNSMFANDLGTIFMTTSAPLRMAEFRSAFNGQNGTIITLNAPAPATDLSRLRDNAYLSLSLNYQIGSPVPKQPQPSVSGAYPFTISISPDAQTWLSISPQQGPPGSTVAITIDPTRLGQGTYQGTVTLTTIFPPDLAPYGSGVVSYPVSINVNAQPTMSAGGGGTSFSVLSNGTSTLSSTISVTTNGTSAAVTASIVPGTGGNWLSVTGGGATPATLTLTANPIGLSPGIYYSSVHIQGPLNAVDIPAEIEIVAPGPPALTMSPPAIALVLEAGQSGARKPGVLTNTIPMTSNFTAVASDPWINFYVFAFGIVVSGDATNLKPGTYTGSITVTPATGAPAVVPVTLTVLAVPQITVSPASLTITTAVGSSSSANLTLASPTGLAIFDVVTIPSTSPALELGYQFTPSYPNVSGVFAPTALQLTASASSPGTYQSGVTVSWTGGSVIIPITVYVTASATAPPLMTAVVASGSALAGAISPGELISIHGQGVGGVPTNLQIDSSGKVATTLGGTQVMINGVAAPIVYTSIDQVNAIVPYEAPKVANGIANVQVTYAGIASQPWAIPVAPSAPSVFAIGSTGVGAGAIVNSNGSVNSPSNPASRGSVIQIYATGGGQTSPASITGAVATGAANLTLPYSVSIGGANAPVIYAGSAPGEADGVVQMNVVVPSSMTGAALPVVVTIGGVASQSVTMAVN